ncbi:MAG: glycosyltransferase family 9 protein [Burkholderiales bacterium]
MRILPRALARRRVRPGGSPQRILVAHHLLPGDVLMLTPLLAKLRARYPAADIAMTVRAALLPLYAGRPCGVRAVRFDPREASTLDELFAGDGYDLAYVAGDNRYSWLAAAAGARWIVAFSGDRPAYKSWPVDEFHSYRAEPAAWGDMVCDLVDGAAPPAHRPQHWPSPPCAPFELPEKRYAVLHVEASTPLKHWEDAKWLGLADALSAAGIEVVWSAGPQGGDYLRRIDPQGRHHAIGHRLDLAQLWRLVEHAALLVCPDTSVMHIGRLTGTPTLALFGPSSAELFGPGEFFRDMPYRAITVADFPCRDQRLLFKREIAWIRRCQRTLAECAAPRCMHAIGGDVVAQAALQLARR